MLFQCICKSNGEAEWTQMCQRLWQVPSHRWGKMIHESQGHGQFYGILTLYTNVGSPYGVRLERCMNDKRTTTLQYSNSAKN